MSISEKVRKELWAKSGNRCAICNEELFQSIDCNSFNIGEECHIVSEKKDGPRHIDDYGDYDAYSNLILLCRNHHKEIDDRTNIDLYTIRKVSEIKEVHENWVNQNLSVNNGKFYCLISGGNQLVSIITNHSLCCCKRNDELFNAEEVELVGGFWQELFDFGDIVSELEPSAVTSQELVFSKMLKELDKNGFRLYYRAVQERMLRNYGDYTLYNTVEFYIRRNKQ